MRTRYNHIAKDLIKQTIFVDIYDRRLGIEAIEKYPALGMDLFGMAVANAHETSFTGL